MFSSSKKPFTAITVQIDRLTSEQYDVDDSGGIVDLIEVIRLQSSGPQEASRALRKKLKYGSVHRQLRALTILDFLIQNAGERFLKSFADEPLLERLRVAATDSVSDPEVREKCKQLFPQWAISYKNTPGMERVALLYKQLPTRKRRPRPQQSKVLKETEEAANEPLGHSVAIAAGEGPSTVLGSPTTRRSSMPPFPAVSGKSKDKKKNRRGQFNLEKERPEILQAIASASVASTNLTNVLKLVNRETQRVSDNAEVMEKFSRCKELRRQILRYIQLVESDDFIGSLIHANEELVNALMAFEVLDKSVDYDSDSEDDLSIDDIRRLPERNVTERFAGLVLSPPAKPPRPQRPMSLPGPLPSTSNPTKKQLAYETASEDSSSEVEEEDDDDENPFGDRNAIPTPSIEKLGLTWRDV
ncbi:VHS domain-containing protein [Coccidioides immitis RS]|uniref:VHS domain-containing protein n=2 Tax=Coccidioides immitis TaxID=5501 RepID=J3KIY8_COCIM|nr:VHS domain-containing protein [Coccidioides immitis RS]EAS35969.3 VHS domain-containing protein [Coccidioides immitis RS]KMU83772.1 hypothetical protein CIHG_01556 [Coccidioides immitis H538.4]TPX25847.1 putative actin patch assembly and actin polymerization protein [Coccidioides immitis]